MGSEQPPFSPESGVNPLEAEAMLKIVSDGIADVAAHEVMVMLWSTFWR